MSAISEFLKALTLRPPSCELLHYVYILVDIPEYVTSQHPRRRASLRAFGPGKEHMERDWEKYRTDKLKYWYYSKNIIRKKNQRMGWDERVARIDTRNVW